MIGLAKRAARKILGRGAADDGPVHRITEQNYHRVPRDQWHHFDEPTLPQQPYALPVPNFALRTNSSGGGDLAYWLGIGDAWAHVVSRFLPPSPAVLDLGCGCGKLTRFLALIPGVRYIGVDIFRPHIQWCERAFAPLGGRFSFHHFDGYSEVYNPDGKIQTVDYRLPADDRSLDMVAAHSLFTHLYEAEGRHYLSEIARILKPGGQAIISLHTEPPAGVAWVNDRDRSDVELDHFLAMASDVGLALKENLGVIYGQTGLLLVRT